jgi:hypothetical protein
VSLLVLTLAAVSAQERRQGGPPYDRSKEQTVTAVVQGVERAQPPQGPAQAILMVSYQDAPLAVFLGPEEWFKAQAMTFAPKATVEITGLTGARFNGKAAIMPRLVKSGGRVLELRDADGVPKWGGLASY